MPLIPKKNTVPEGALQVRRAVTRVGREASHACRRIRQIVRRHGRAAILAELGDDAADVYAFYNDIAALSLKYVGEEIGPIPSDPVEGEEPKAPTTPEG